MSSTENFHIPDECWESVFKSLNHQRYLEPLSLVSKQFLSITNRVRSNYPLKISDPTLPSLPQIFRRFPTLTSLNLTLFHNGDLNALLYKISNSNIPLRSLDLSHQQTFPSNGLRALSKKITTLKSLNCSYMGSLKNTDLLLIVDCFPFLEELDISYPEDVSDYRHNRSNPNNNNFDGHVSNFGVKALSLGLPKLRKVDLSGNYFVNCESIFNLCSNCELLEELFIFDCCLISQKGIVSAIRERPNLRSLNVNELGVGVKRVSFAWANVTSDFIGSLVSLKSLSCIDLSYSCISDELLWTIAEEGLPLRKIVLQSCTNYSYDGISCLLSKCQLVQHLDLQGTHFLNDQCVSKLSVLLGSFSNLRYINLSGTRITDSSFLALTMNCRLLSEVKMEQTFIGKEKVEDPLTDLVVNSQVKSLHLVHNFFLGDESIKMFASVCPNLEKLDLSFCRRISDGVVFVLKRCCNLRYLNLDYFDWKVKKLCELDFEAPKLEVLNLSRSRIEDDALIGISQRCPGLLHLELEYCFITEKAVKQVVENCRQLREINMKDCHKVAANVVAWMVFSRPSLRKIIGPRKFHLSDSQRELFLRHGCYVIDSNICVRGSESAI